MEARPHGGLSLAVAGACLPFGALAEEPETAEGVEWTVSKSKTATNLDENFESQVILSLPADNYKEELDVVLVIDDTSATSSIFTTAAEALLNDLKAKDNLDINIGIVTFDALARDWLSVTTGGDLSGLVALNDENYDDICKAIGTPFSSSGSGQQKRLGGTNTSDPLKLAQEILDSGNGTEKHAIMFSDMYGYVYYGSLTVGENTYEDVPLSKRLGGFKLGQLCISAPKYDSWTEVYAHKKDNDSNLDSFFRDYAGSAQTWVDYWTLYRDFDLTTMPSLQEYETIAPTVPQYGTDGEQYKYFTPFEHSSCLTYDQILTMADAGIQVTIVNNDFNPGDHGDTIQNIKNGMLTDLESKGVTVIKQTIEHGSAFSDEQINTIFTALKNDLIQLVDAGSVIVDEIGSGNDYDFAFVNDLDKLSLMVGGTALNKVKIESAENPTYGFGPQIGEDDEKTYPFTVTYYEDGYTDGTATYGECFVCNINVPVTVDAQVKLIYAVKLTNPKTEPGTYGVYDYNGSQNQTGLYTNNSAVLYPVDSKGNLGSPEVFPKPTVSYTVEEPEPTATPTPTPAADPTPAPTSKDEHPEIAQAIKDGTWGKADPTPTPSADPAVKVTSTHIPQTGDTSNPVLWVVAMVAALAAFAGVVILRRRSNKD